MKVRNHKKHLVSYPVYKFCKELATLGIGLGVGEGMGEGGETNGENDGLEASSPPWFLFSETNIFKMFLGFVTLEAPC